MKVLVVGGGGREHALCWKIARSPLVEEVLCAPGNAGTAAVARNVDVAANDLDGILRLAGREGVGLAVIGPEEPLCLGLADRLRAAGVPTFGPGAAGARLEGSKAFAKEIVERYRIPTAAWRQFDRSGAAKSYLETCTLWPQVVKADGLAAGKGVFICEDTREGFAAVDAIMEERRLGEAGERVVIEEFLEGEEASVFAVTDGHAILILEPVMDHKQVGDGDSGPNTGGMGVVSPVMSLNRRLQRQIEQRVLVPTVHALRREEIEYRGVLFVGLIMTESGPKVLEYNARFGDPETQALVRRFQPDLFPYLLATAEARLSELEPPDWDPRTCVGVVSASEGYPGEYRKGDSIRGLEEAAAIEEVVIFHAGTELDHGTVVANGGRVLCATALGKDLAEARERAYSASELISWEGRFFRRDIGTRVPKRRRVLDEEPERAPRREDGPRRGEDVSRRPTPRAPRAEISAPEAPARSDRALGSPPGGGER